MADKRTRTRTPRYPPLLVVLVVGFALIRLFPTQYSTIPLVILWVKKHDLWAALSGNDPWNAVLRTLGLQWTREIAPGEPDSKPEEANEQP